jgi:hypothetical protein
MIIPERLSLERRVLDVLNSGAAAGPDHVRVVVVPGGCGTGRTSLLLRLRDLLGRNAAQYVDVERIATTPERFARALRDTSPFPMDTPIAAPAGDGSSREAFGTALAFLAEARGSTDAPVTFLLDEFLELRTFESFPGLRAALRDLMTALASSRNRFVLTTRYVARAHRLLRDAPVGFEMLPVTPLDIAEIRATLPPLGGFKDDEEDHARDDLARLVHALSNGRPAYARLIAEATAAMMPQGDPISALCGLLAHGGQLADKCRFSYELRLHRARGYGALKAILDVLSEEEPLTLTEIALRLRRTPGSTKDYLSWLEDVDLIESRQKRYRFADALLRLWVRLHCRAVPPSEEDVAREVHAYFLERSPDASPALAMSAAPRAVGPERNWGIIEID